jgi:hypothetical protein
MFIGMNRPRCPSARRPNPGRGSTYRRGKVVQTTGTSSISAFELRQPTRRICALALSDRPPFFFAFSFFADFGLSIGSTEPSASAST